MQFVAFGFQTLAWILDAADAGKLHGTYHRSYGLAVAAAILGFLVSMYTLFLSIGLIFMYKSLAELCGGARDCCGDSSSDKPVGYEESTPQPEPSSV